MTKGLCVPLMEAWWKVHKKTAKGIWKPFESFNEWFWELPNAPLWFCGFIVILAPLYAGYLGFFLAIQALVAVIFIIIGVTQGLAFMMVGIWPAFILSICICGITIITWPRNIYYHALVTYRTVMLRRNLKLLSFLLLPFTHILIPPVALIIALFTLLPWFAAKSFIGFPTAPWKKIETISKKAWKKFGKDTKKFAENYGHESGIPQDWDGKVYGLAVDPLVVIIAIFLYLIGILGMSPVIFLIFTIKAIPIFLETLIQFWRNISLMTAVVWYIKTLAGSHENSTNTNPDSRRPRTPAPGWIKSLKSTIKDLKRGIEGYSKLKILKIYTEILNDYSLKIEAIDPAKLGKLISEYSTELNPTKVIPSDIGVEIIILWIPILMVFFMWILGLGLVLTIPPATFLAGFVLWVLAWPIVIVAPPVLYIVGWALIIFGLPILYVFLWCAILVGPWLMCAIGSITGPVLALRVPSCMLAYTRYNPIIIWDNSRRALVKGYKICRAIDRWTTKSSFCKIRIFCGDNPDNLQKEEKEERGSIEYWILYTQRCIQESRAIQTKNWLSSDDILSVSSTATIAIPGVAIASILEDTAKRNNNKEKMLVYWNNDNVCKDSNRDLGDNIANVFLPQLMKIKELMLDLPKEDFEQYCSWIKASLCDGEDEKSLELSKALAESNTMSEDGKKKCMKIRALIENVVHALLRVKEMSSKLPEIFSSSIEDDDEANTTQNNEVPYSTSNAGPSSSNIEINMDTSDDPELALAINLSLEDERARQEAMNNGIEDNGGEILEISDSTSMVPTQPSTQSQIPLTISLSEGSII